MKLREKLQQAMKARDVAQMRTIPADQITVTAASNKIVFSGPTIDGYVIPGHPKEVYAAGQQQDVPLLLASVGNDIFSKNAVTDARSLADYAAFSGIDYAARTLAPQAFRPKDATS